MSMCANHIPPNPALAAPSASTSMEMPKRSDAVSPPYPFPNSTLALGRRQEGLRAPATLPALSPRPTRAMCAEGMCVNHTATTVVAKDTKTIPLPTLGGIGSVAG